MNKKEMYLLKRRLFRCLLLLVPLLYAHWCTSQEETHQLNFDYLTIKEGLSHNTVQCIIQDHHGYIWIGTQYGLNKYDGYDFEVYRSIGDQQEPSGFLGKSISSLFEDSKGNLWVGTKKHGINILEQGKDRFINFQSDSSFEDIRGYDISSFYEDRSGNIWITTVGGGLLKYNPETNSSKIYTATKNGLSNDLAFALVEDLVGTIWVATAGSGLNYLLKGENQFNMSHVNLEQNPNMNGYRKTLFLEGNHLWIGTEGSGLYRMKVKERDYTHFPQGDGMYFPNSNVIRDIHRGPGGKLFLATDGGGLNVLDESTNTFLKYTYEAGSLSGINSNALHNFLEDRTGNLWIGTYNGGLNVLKVNKTWFQFITPTSKRNGELESRSILSLCQAKDGTIWIGTDGGGLNKLIKSNNLFSFSTLKNDPLNQNSLAGNAVKSIYEDSEGDLWLGMFGVGLDKLDLSSQTFTHYFNQDGGQSSLIENNIWTIDERKNGNLWIGTIGGGLYVFDRSSRTFSSFTHDPTDLKTIGDNNIMVIFIDRDDTVWVGNADNGLDKWDDATSRFLHYKHNPLDSFSLSNDEVRSIFQDSRGNLWIGTEGGGLNLWKGGGRFETFKTEDGLIANSVMGITEDKNGMIWISTFRGISRLNPNTQTFLNFDFHTGQNNNQFNQSSILASDDGWIFFGGINGLNAIHPDQVKEDRSQHDILFTGLKVLDKDISAGVLEDSRAILDVPIEDADKVTLKHSDNSFSIHFSAIDYTSPLNHIFYYKMEGFDDNWQSISGGKHSASYTNLDPGNFTFRVLHEGKEASIDVIVKPPFWKSTWFLICALLFVSGSIYLLLYFIIKRRESDHKQEILEAKSKILKLQNIQLENQVSAKNSKLLFSAVQMAHKNEILSTVKEELKDIQREPNKELRQLMRSLDQEIMSEDYWKEFNVYFDQVDHNFVHEIYKKHPDLTNNDLRLCTLMRINLSTKEIASLLNISARGVEKGRYRLKKRLGLSREEDLAKYITGFQVLDFKA